MVSKVSPFLFPGPVSTAGSLAIVHLKRDLQIPTILKEHDEDDEGYFEGKVLNTRFGSFPHSTLIGLPWGSQVRASVVDTGSRGRRVKGQQKKRKREESEATTDVEQKRSRGTSNGLEGNEVGDVEGDVDTPTTQKGDKEAVAASSGFIHLLPPTPENWTSSLPHRTQVVYTPDYSYILHRLRVRPGTSLIEAGAGSGSFTHASARAVYSGYAENTTAEEVKKRRRKLGKVWSFEFHEQRYEKLATEIKDHGLEGIVEITHRDVCEDGFLVGDESPNAEAVFLDLPAPWLALPHLTRSPPPLSNVENEIPSFTANSPESKRFVSILNPTTPVRICTFSPCIEQVQRTVSVMRQLGWVDIEMVEVAQKRFDIRRERIGIDHGAQKGVQSTPASVDEALARLIEVEGNFKSFHEGGVTGEGKKQRGNPNSRERIIESLVERKVYKDGRLVHRTEPDVKTHTSYLVFAILPEEWTAADEEKARAKWPVLLRSTDGRNDVDGAVIGMSRRQVKRAERQEKKQRAAATAARDNTDETSDRVTEDEIIHA